MGNRMAGYNRIAGKKRGETRKDKQASNCLPIINDHHRKVHG